jgi:hypothetical protein
MFDELKKRHRDANEFTLFAQWQKVFRCSIDGESATQFREVPLEIRAALDRIFNIAAPTRDNLEVMLLLNALTGKAESVQRSLIADVANKSLTLDAVLRRFRVEANVRERGDTAALADGFAAAITSADPRCKRCAGFGHRASACPSAREWERSPQVEAILSQPPPDAKHPRGPFSALLPRADGKSRGGGNAQRARGGGRGGRGRSRPSMPSRGSAYAIIGGVPHGLVDGRLYPVGTPPGSSPSSLATAAAALEEEHSPDVDHDTGEESWEWGSGYAMDIALPIAIPIKPESDVADWRARGEEECVYQLSSNPGLLVRRSLGAWVLDSGATMHCTPELTDLAAVRSIAPVNIRGIGSKIVRATKVGDMTHHLANGSTFRVRGVLYIPGVDIRLISLGRLADAGLETRLSADAAHIIRSSDGGVAATGTRVGTGLYTLDLASEPTALVAHHAFAAVPDEVWHARLGHPAHDHVHRLATSGAVQGMHLDLSFRPPVCQSCIRGKQKVSAVPKRRVGEKSGAFMDLVYCDLSGSVERTATPNGEHYSMSMLDDYSSYLRTELLKTKDQAADFIIAWHARVSRRHGRTLRTLQIDNGELKSKKLDTWAAGLGIEVRYTAPYSSSQNGRIERAHQTIAGTARAIRLACELPENMWGECTQTASYLFNFRLTSSLPANTTPHEARFQKKPNLSHLRELGCKAFVLIQNVHITKIQPRSLECIFIGYDLNSKSYRCYHRSTRRIIVSRNVYFVESHQLHPRPFKPGQSIVSLPPPSSGEHPDGWPRAPDAPASTPPAAPPALSSVEPPAPRGVELEPDTSPPAEAADAHRECSPSDVRKRAAYREKRKARSRLRASTTPSTTGAEPPRSRVECVDVPDEEPAPQPRRSTRDHRAPAEPGDISARHRQVLDDVRSGAERARERKEQGKAPPVDIFAAVDSDPSLSSHDVFGMLADFELGEVSLDALFGELLDDELVDFAASLEVLDDEDTLTLKQALSGPERDKWRQALLEEFESIPKMGTFQLVPRSSVPTARRILKGKAVFKRKRNEVGDIVRYKARWVVQGFLQVYGQDYNKTTSPTARLESIRILCHIAAAEDLEIRQFNVKSAFLHGTLPEDERVYMEQPPGFEDPHQPDHIWQLLKGLYGMKQAGRLWNEELNGAKLRCVALYCGSVFNATRIAFPGDYHRPSHTQYYIVE